MLSRVIFLFFRLHDLRALPCIGLIGLLINSYSISTENSSLFGLNLCFLSRLHSFWFYVIQRRSKVHINISIDNADRSIVILRRDFQNVNLKLFIEDLDANGIALMQASKVTKLILENGSWILHINELGLMWLQLHHMSHVAVLFLEVSHQGNGARRARFRKFEHFEHPIRNVAKSFLCNEFQHTAICHF